MVTFVQKLVRGSSEINRMQDEIALILGMIESMLPEKPGSDRVVEGHNGVSSRAFSLGPHKMHWHIDFYSAGEKRIHVSCYIGPFAQKKDRNSNLLTLNVGESKRVKNHRHVEMVYHDLDRFIGQVLEVFPELNSSFAPFIKAAER